MDITGIEPGHIAQFAAIFDKEVEEKDTVEIIRVDKETINIPDGETWAVLEPIGWNIWHGNVEILNTRAYIKLPKL